MNGSYIIQSDGGSRGNPGLAAYGFVIYDPTGQELKKQAQTIGMTTNNQAEYQGIVAALEAAQALHLEGPIICKLDSQLVVRQINGLYKMKSPELKPWLQKIHILIGQFAFPVTFIDVRREDNKEADRLVNLALDGA